MPTIDLTNGHFDFNDAGPNAANSDSRTLKVLTNQSTPESPSGTCVLVDNQTVLADTDKLLSWRHGGTEKLAIFANGSVTSSALGIVNVKSKGAKGDGVTDDTVAIQAAMTAAGTGIVFVPPGTYITSSTLSMSFAQTLMGCGNQSSIIKYSGAADAVLIDSRQGCTVKDIEIIVAGAAGTERGIRITNTTANSQWHNIVNVRFLAFPSLRTAGQIALLVESPAAHSQYWSHYERIYIQNFDKGIVFNGANSAQVVNGHVLYNIMGAANVSTMEIQQWSGDNVIFGMFISGSGYTTGTGITIGSLGTCGANRVYGLVSDATGTSVPYVVGPNATDTYIDVNIEGGTESDSGNRTMTTTARAVSGASAGRNYFSGQTLAPPYWLQPYSSSITPDARSGNIQEINATNGTAFTINAPTNPLKGMQLTIKIKNTSGGALGVATWNAVFKMPAWVQPLSTFNRSVTFHYDGANWVEQYRSAADTPN